MTFPLAHPALGRALAARGYSIPTAVQLAVLEANTAARDLLVSAQTGSGKTVAFGLAIAPTLLGDAERLPQAAEPLALIIAPTRELALQVQRELDWLYKDTGARVVACVGGMDARAEARQLGYGAHIVVGTPGRLRDHLERQRLDLSKLAAVVLDEADEMLDLGFREDLEFILDASPESRQTLLFSATMPREIAALAGRYQRDAVRIETLRRNEQHADIDYRAIRVVPGDTENAVVNVLRFYEAAAAIVFCSTREAVKRMHARLVERGFSAVALSGELTQNERAHALQALRDGRARVLVATDVAARGLDLPALALVIHADLPNDAETLLHRSGRTGRAGNKGLCMVIVPFNRRRKADALLAGAKLKVTWGPAPTAEEIRARDQERLLASAIFTDPATEEDIKLAEALKAGRTADEIALALARVHRAGLPAPEDLAEDTGPPPRRDARSPAPRERSRHRPDHAREARSHAPQDRDNGASPRDSRPPRPVRDHGREMVWFRVDIGRERKADPRWLLPLLCRAGDVTKSEIGAIKIFDRDTRFQIAAEFADKFAETARSMKPNEGRITRIGASMGDDAGMRSNPAHAAPARKDGEPRTATASSDRQPDVRAKTPWRDRKNGKTGGHPHRKGEAPRSHPKAPRPHAGSPKSHGAHKPVSKYAHKKKHRAAPQT
ncbi:DEAD/DEAH box helicase [Hyphomicrobium sp. CS1GBMeth3]|uniref:DEAD/DEAH box helicase n=1 Tax=Hyphomicrobium sp. CS1GBMeth3 TaxID=1892845 RepID=UPI000931B0C0|nr:DEAD/DEAH box helicase [Hyphomicrobium sp. CS1GBMeth3]